MPYLDPEKARLYRITYWADPKNRARQRARETTPEYRARHRAAERLRRAAAIGNDPAFREAERARNANRRKNAAYIERERLSAAKRRQIPENRVRASLATAARRADPEKQPSDRLRDAAYVARRRREDRQFAIKARLRDMIRKRVKRQSRTKHAATEALLGCSFSDFLVYWDQILLAYGYTPDDAVQIDHLIPCAAFDLTDQAQQGACFHYTNLRPLSGAENKKKGGRPPSDEEVARHRRLLDQIGVQDRLCDYDKRPCRYPRCAVCPVPR